MVSLSAYILFYFNAMLIWGFSHLLAGEIPRATKLSCRGSDYVSTMVELVNLCEVVFLEEKVDRHRIIFNSGLEKSEYKRVLSESESKRKSWYDRSDLLIRHRRGKKRCQGVWSRVIL